MEAPVWFFETTGDALALDVAQRIVRHHLIHLTNTDGSMRQEIIHPENIGHSHSFQGTLRGLLLFGLLSGQRKYVQEEMPFSGQQYSFKWRGDEIVEVYSHEGPLPFYPALSDILTNANKTLQRTKPLLRAKRW